MGPDVSSTVVRDWARWGRHEAYLHGPFGLETRANRYRGRVLAFSFADDVGLGYRRAVEVLHRDYVEADVEHRHVHPEDVGVRRLGHFGFFRGRAAAELWDQTVAWLDPLDAPGRGADEDAEGRGHAACPPTRSPEGEQREAIHEAAGTGRTCQVS